MGNKPFGFCLNSLFLEDSKQSDMVRGWEWGCGDDQWCVNFYPQNIEEMLWYLSSSCNTNVDDVAWRGLLYFLAKTYLLQSWPKSYVHIPPSTVKCLKRVTWWLPGLGWPAKSGHWSGHENQRTNLTVAHWGATVRHNDHGDSMERQGMVYPAIWSYTNKGQGNKVGKVGESVNNS